MFIHALNMPRRSIVDQIVDNHPLWEIKPQLHYHGYLILYSFGSRTQTRFYEALERIQESLNFQKLNRGVLIAHGVNDAYSLLKLIYHYNGECRLYSAYEIDAQEIFDKYE